MKFQNIIKLSLIKSFNSYFNTLQKQKRDASWSNEISSLFSDLFQLILMIIDYLYTNEMKEYTLSCFFSLNYELLF